MGIVELWSYQPPDSQEPRTVSQVTLLYQGVIRRLTTHPFLPMRMVVQAYLFLTIGNGVVVAFQCPRVQTSLLVWMRNNYYSLIIAQVLPQLVTGSF